MAWGADQGTGSRGKSNGTDDTSSRTKFSEVVGSRQTVLPFKSLPPSPHTQDLDQDQEQQQQQQEQQEQEQEKEEQANPKCAWPKRGIAELTDASPDGNPLHGKRAKSTFFWASL